MKFLCRAKYRLWVCSFVCFFVYYYIVTAAAALSMNPWTNKIKKLSPCFFLCNDFDIIVSQTTAVTAHILMIVEELFLMLFTFGFISWKQKNQRQPKNTIWIKVRKWNAKADWAKKVKDFFNIFVLLIWHYVKTIWCWLS